MVPSSPEKYAARLTELEALHHELETGKRPGDGAVVVGLLLEAAGDVLRRKAATRATAANVTRPLSSIPELGLRSWGDAVQVAELALRLKRAASQAVESALPDSDEEGKAMAEWAVQDLQARDRLESALVALEALASSGRKDAQALAERLRSAVGRVDRTARAAVASLTALNGARRAEAALIDPEFRGQAWWYSERTGIDDDQLVQVLGGEVKGSMPPELKSVNSEVNRKRGRPVSFDDLGGTAALDRGGHGSDGLGHDTFTCGLFCDGGLGGFHGGQRQLQLWVCVGLKPNDFLFSRGGEP